MLTGMTLAGTDPTRASMRTFWVRVPADYDPNRAYRLVYVSPGCGGYEVANTTTYPLFKEAQGGTEQAVYVALDIPRDMSNQDCFDTRAGLGSEEWEAFAAIQSAVDSTYCVDDNSIFVDSYGDDAVSLANMWGCYFAGNPADQRIIAPARHIRGQSSVSGGEPPDLPACGGPVAALWIHDLQDGYDYASDVHALDRVLAGNGCQGDHTSSPTAPWPVMPDVCLQYTTCPADYPVVFCTTMGQGHGNQPDRAIPAFTAFDDLASPMTSSPHATIDAGDAGDAGATDAASQ
jgi:poly(3-hydroxybutyrate) depolymerase